MKTPKILCLAVMMVAGQVAGLSADALSAGERRAEITLSRDARAQLESAMADLGRYGVLGAVVRVEGDHLKPTTLTYGFADIDHKVPMDAGKNFLIASQTKMFTAAAVLSLVKEGKISLDDKVTKYIPEFPEAGAITIRQLLHHVSGLGDGSVFLTRPRPMPRVTLEFRDVLLMTRIVGPEFEPGKRYSYNNFGYYILGEIIERASGASRKDYLKKKFFEPLGMKATYVGAEESWPLDIMAKGYEWNAACDCRQETHNPPNITWASAAGDLVSNVDDLMKWAKMLGDAKNPVGLSLADFNREEVNIDRPGVMVRYGFGMIAHNLGGLEVWGHGGSINGYYGLTVVDPKSGLRAVILLNLTGDKAPPEAAAGTINAMLDVLKAGLTLGRAAQPR